jgi:hypothetical protein
VIWKVFFSKKKSPAVEIGKEITKEKLTPPTE